MIPYPILTNNKIFMEKKDLLLGSVCLIAAMALIFKQGNDARTTSGVEPRDAQSIVAQQKQGGPLTKEPIPPPISVDALTTTQSMFKKVAPEQILKAKEKVQKVIQEQFVTLENDCIRVRFTNLGGAIKDVELKRYPAAIDSKEPYIFNTQGNDPALAISVASGDSQLTTYAPKYTLVQKTDTSLQFLYETPEGIRIIRGYRLQNDSKNHDAYVIVHETKFVNQSSNAFDLSRICVNLGTIPATKGDRYGDYLNFGCYNGKKGHFIKVRDFHGSSGFLGFGVRASSEFLQESKKYFTWGAIKNQFFTAVLTPEVPATGYFVQPVPIDSGKEEGINGHLEMSLGVLEPKKEGLLQMNYYVGPKEYLRLSKLGQNQDQVMEFGFFGAVSKLLLLLMLGIHKVIPSWGLTIIVITAIIKLLLWPLTNSQVRSAKRMNEIQKPLKDLKAKHTGNPQKLQSETMKLFKEHKINPAAGCLPLIIQLPLFIGFYFMLRTCSEIRFQKFLWISDLSVSDTVFYIASFPINIMPLIMAVTMFIQMRMTPTPTTDAVQQKMMQFMPLLFVIFCYHLPSALTLYWTAQNIFTIVQQLLTSRKSLAGEVVVPKKHHKR